MIYIFGDSFGDPAKDRVWDRHGECFMLGGKVKWYNLFEEEHINLCETGSSTHRAFDRFYNYFDKSAFKPKDKIVFLLTSQYRIRDNILSHIFMQKNSLISRGEIFDIVYTSFEREIDFLNYKNLAYLKWMQELIGCKMIVFRCFDFKDMHIDVDYPEHLYDTKVLNSQNFFVHPSTLCSVSIDETISDHKHSMIWGEWRRNGFDIGRCNHLSDVNQQILFNIIKKFFYGPIKGHPKWYAYAVDKFKTNCYTENIVEADSPNMPEGDFLYE
jgi:hypothetical protein